MGSAFLCRFFLIWQPQPIYESGILSNFCLYDSPACKVCFAGRISYNNLYTGRISLYKRIRRGCCSGYFNNNNIPARHRIKNSALSRRSGIELITFWPLTQSLSHSQSVSQSVIHSFIHSVSQSVSQSVSSVSQLIRCGVSAALANLLGQ